MNCSPIRTAFSMFVGLCCVALPILSAGCSDTAAPQLLAIDCEQAAADATVDIVGLRDRGACAWLGLRYAEPITPSGRFLPPVLRPLGSGTITATEFGADCLQSNSPMSEQPQSEDCLFLNIWAPGASPDGMLQRALPVMVWVHGGGFTQGAGNWSLYNGAAFARQGVVLVAINYRLGALGFAAPDGVTHDNGTELAGNLGVRDTLTALEWVQQHIARFGGDPDRVTVFGESAGAWMTCALLAAGAGDDGLLHRAIMESGGCYIASRERAAEFGQKWMNEIPCPRYGPDAFRCLQQISAEQFVSKFDMGMRSGSWPVIDGKLFTDQTLAMLAERTPVPLIAGYNREELEVAALADLEPERYRYTSYREFWALFDTFSEAEVAALQSLYPEDRFETPFDAGQAMINDQIFGCAIHDAARAFAGRAYRFATDADWFTLEPYTGTFHGAEIPFVFGNLDLLTIALRPPDGLNRAVELSDLVQRYWIRFATTGDPNGSADPLWPGYDDGDQLFQLQLDPQVMPGELSDRCAFWSERLPVSFNERIDWILDHLPFETSAL